MQRPPWLRQLSFVDACAALISLAALAGVVWSPKLTNAVAKATGSVRPVELSVDVTNLLVADPDDLLRSIEAEGQLSFVIRNQPAGRVRVVDVARTGVPVSKARCSYESASTTARSRRRSRGT